MFDPAGEGARQITDLFWEMAAGAALIWLAVVSLTVYAVSSGTPSQVGKRPAAG